MSHDYNPDVLNCLANLSNDEVFTPPELVNQILDSLPKALWHNKNATFLDPACKSGIFLREITKRLIKGLEKEIPDLQERVNHIFSRQIFGIAITELTGYIARRTVYCAKKANSPLSITQVFNKEQGNISYFPIQHKWEKEKCLYCGISKNAYLRTDQDETYAYNFIHGNSVEKFFGEKMRFNVIIGNPPYQLADSSNSASAKPIYHLFIEQAKKLNPDYLIMITPSRWFSGGKGLDDFREKMLSDKRIKEIHDFPNSQDCFTGVDIEGGVSYFVWEKAKQDADCLICTYENRQLVSSMKRPLKETGLDVFVRYNKAITILRKVQAKKEKSFAEIVSSSKPFGLRTFVKGKEIQEKGDIILYQNGGIGYIPRNAIMQNQHWIDRHKIYISYAYGMGSKEPYQVINTPFYGKPNSCCTETYLLIGTFENEEICSNVLQYMSSKFFRFLIFLIKNTQHGTQRVYQLVPMQDFTQSWTDEKLYQKYGLNEYEIAFIEKMIRPMELNHD